MYRDIIITTSGGLNFTQTEQNIVQDDVQGYRIVYKLSSEIDGFIKVTAKLDSPIFGTAPISGDTAYYVIPNSMYAVEGDVPLRVSIVTADERVITTKEITLKVIEANGEADLAGDDRVPALDTLIAEVIDLKNQVTVVLENLTDVEGEIQQHLINTENPHATSYENLGGTNPSYTKAEANALLDGKVDKVVNKGLSTNDYTDLEKTKLSTIEDNAEVNVIETVNVDGTPLTPTDKAVNIDLSGKVDVVTGKGLSTEDFTTTEKLKLAGIEENANNYVLPADVVQDSAYVHTDNNFTDALNTKLDALPTNSELEADLANKVVGAFTSPNLFNKATTTDGYIIQRLTGEIAANAEYCTSDYISIEPGLDYIKNNDTQVAFFNSSKVFVSGLPTGTITFTVPANCVFIRISCLLTQKDTFQFEQGTESTPYLNYNAKYITSAQLYSEDRPFKTVKQIMSQLVFGTGKKVKLIGDSITQGVGGTGFAQDGEVIMTLTPTTWNVNTSGYCWANLLKTFLEEKFDCDVYNYGCTGTNSAQIVTGLSQLIDGDEDIVICMIGTNDRHNNTQQQFYNNLISIYNYCSNLGIEVIFMSNIPTTVANDAEAIRVYHMEDVDHIIMKASTDLKIEYISVFKLFVEYCKSRNIEIDTLLSDVAHPTDAGYDVMFYLICNALGFGTKRPGATW